MNAPVPEHPEANVQIRGGGELGEMIRAYNWAATPLGAISAWPQSLLTTINTMINSRASMCLFWGPQYICFYNDAYRPTLGSTKHPAALGRRAEDLWREIWPTVSPQLDHVMASAEATWREDHLLPFDRSGYTEENYFTYSYSPVFLKDGEIGGVLAAVNDSTERVLAERRLTTLRDVATLRAPQQGYETVAQRVAEVLSRNPHDVPFFICYDVRDGVDAKRMSAIGADDDAPLNPLKISLSNDRDAAWPLKTVLETCEPLVIPDLDARFLNLVERSATVSPHSAIVLPIMEPLHEVSNAIAIIGVNPRKALDDVYWQFLELLSSQMGAAFGAASTAENERMRLGTLQESERELRAVLDNVVAMVCIMEVDGTVAEVNEMPLQLAGIGRREVLGKLFWDCPWWNYDGDMQAAVRDACASASQGEPSRYDTVVRMDGGQLMTVDFLLAPLFDRTGNVTRLIASAFDITEREKSMRELASARHLADAANKAKSEFLANISHEIRSPLAAILGYAEILEAQLKNPDDRRNAATIYDCGQHLLALVNDVLDLSRIEAGRFDMNSDTFELTVMLEGLYASFIPAADEKELSLTIRSVSPVPSALIGDVKRIRQILVNLLSNAIKFTKSGSIGINVELLFGDDGTTIKFCVHDTGPGIEASQRGNLFQAFSQIDATNARVHDGAGLGLAISQGLASALGGSVQLESTPGSGSVFTLCVPIQIAPDSIDIKAGTEFIAADSDRSKSAALRQISGRILAVDDRRDMRFLIAEYLESAGAEVVTAASAREAFARIDHAQQINEPFDAVVMDIQMPEIDGYRATEQLRAQGFRQPIIALTASAMKGDEERCLAAGCSMYLTKPVDRRLLAETLGLALDAQWSSSSPAASVPHSEQARAAQVLVVDDDQNAATALAKLLTMKGFEVTSVPDGRSALEHAREALPDFSIIDIRLPDIPGFEVAAGLREAANGAPLVCIALSGLDLAKADIAGSAFDHSLLKPVNVGELVDLLQVR